VKRPQKGESFKSKLGITYTVGDVVTDCDYVGHDAALHVHWSDGGWDLISEFPGWYKRMKTPARCPTCGKKR
jgi:hypothetical protein